MTHSFFFALGRWIVRRATIIIIAALLLTGASAWYAQKTLVLNADYDDLVSEDLQYHRDYKQFLKEFGDQEYLYVVVEGGENAAQAKTFLDALGGRLRQIPSLKEITWKIQDPHLEKNFLLTLDRPTLEGLRHAFTGNLISARELAAWRDFDDVVNGLVRLLDRPMTPQVAGSLEAAFVPFEGMVGEMVGAFAAKPYHSLFNRLAVGSDNNFDIDGYFRNGDLFFLFIMPVKDFTTMEVIAEPLRAIRQGIDATKAEFPGITAGLTGRPVLAADELATTNRDMNIATIAAILLIGLFFVVFFRSASRPLMAMAALLMGIAWTFGVTALLFGELTIISIVFALILVGAAIEYGIHFIARYQEELANGLSVAGSVEKTLFTAGRSDVTSAVTTACAFLTIMWTDFTALAELGAIAGIGILLCLIAMLVVLPAMVVVRDRRRSAADLRNVAPFRFPLVARWAGAHKVTLAISALITIALLPFVARVRFDNNLLNLQAEGLESVRLEKLIIEKSSETTWFAHATADDLSELRQKAAAFRTLKTVRRVDDIRRLIPDDQEEKKAIIAQLAPAFSNLHLASPSQKIDLPRLQTALAELQERFETLQAEAFSAGRAEAVQALESFLEKLGVLQGLLASADEAGLARLGRVQAAFVGELQQGLSLLGRGMHPTGIALEDIPPELARRFVSSSGKYALWIYPQEDIWNPAALSAFVGDMRRIDAHVLGTPIEVEESGGLMRKAFAISAGLAMAVILLLVWLDFRSLRVAAMAVLPLLVGMLWLLGLMGLLDIPFNMANFFALPILIGIGVDNGVHLVHRLQQEGSLDALASSTGKGVLLTALTNAIGFGMMMIAAHRGLASLGQIMALGCLTCLVASFVALPPVAGRVMRLQKRSDHVSGSSRSQKNIFCLE